MIYNILIAGKDYRLELSHNGSGWSCRLDGREVQMDAALTQRDVLSILIEGRSYEIKRERVGEEAHLWVRHRRYMAEVRDPRGLRGRQVKGARDHGPQKLTAMMPGKVVRILAQERAEVEAGQGVLVIEAMKMQNEIKSPKKGVVAKIVAKEGDRVNPGDVLAIVE